MMLRKDRYNKKKYDQVNIRLLRGKKELLKQAAAALNVSINKFVSDAIYDKINNM